MSTTASGPVNLDIDTFGVFPWSDSSIKDLHTRNEAVDLIYHARIIGRGAVECSGKGTQGRPCKNHAIKRYGNWQWCGQCTGHQSSVVSELTTAAARGDAERFDAAWGHPDQYVRQWWALRAPAELLTAERIETIFEDTAEVVNWLIGNRALGASGFEAVVTKGWPWLAEQALGKLAHAGPSEWVSAAQMMAGIVEPPQGIEAEPFERVLSPSEASSIVLEAIDSALAVPADDALFERVLRTVAMPSAERHGCWGKWLKSAESLMEGAAEAAAQLASEAHLSSPVRTAGRMWATIRIAMSSVHANVSHKDWAENRMRKVSNAALRTVASAMSAADCLGEIAERRVVEHLPWRHIRTWVLSAGADALYYDVDEDAALSRAVADLLVAAVRCIEDDTNWVTLEDPNKTDRSWAPSLFGRKLRLLTSDDCARIAAAAGGRPYIKSRTQSFNRRDVRTVAGDICDAVLCAENADTRTGRALLANRSTDLRTAVVASDAGRSHRSRVLADKDLEVLAGRASRSLVHEVIYSRHVTDAAIQVAAASSDPRIRAAAVRVPSQVPEAILVLLSMDPDKGVSEEAMAKLKKQRDQQARLTKIGMAPTKASQ